jgi:hypothetical protein
MWPGGDMPYPRFHHQSKDSLPSSRAAGGRALPYLLNQGLDPIL